MRHAKPRYRLNEALELLGLARSTAYTVIAAGELKPHKDGRRTFISADEIDRYVRHRDAARPETKTPGQSPVLKGDPIEERMSEARRTEGNAGGLAKARKGQETSGKSKRAA